MWGLCGSLLLSSLHVQGYQQTAFTSEFLIAEPLKTKLPSDFLPV